MERQHKRKRHPIFRRVQAVTSPGMAYAAGIIVLAVILGAIGTANHLPALAELATLALLAGLVMLARAIWHRSRRDQLDTNV